MLEKSGLPKKTIKQLRKLDFKTFKDRKMFLEAVEKLIGKEQTVKYKSAILDIIEYRMESFFIFNSKI